MSLRLIKAAAAIEATDEFHQARLLLLLNAASGRGDDPKPVDGIMKLAKMDFLLRYPNCLARALDAFPATSNSIRSVEVAIPEEDIDTIEARMIRFRYGPWDNRYRRWLGVLAAKGLVSVWLQGRTVRVAVSRQGRELARSLADRPEFAGLAQRSRVIVTTVGHMGATALKNFVYKTFPELNSMKWGESIEL
jgi:hypothetical protein